MAILLCKQGHPQRGSSPAASHDLQCKQVSPCAIRSIRDRPGAISLRLRLNCDHHIRKSNDGRGAAAMQARFKRGPSGCSVRYDDVADMTSPHGCSCSIANRRSSQITHRPMNGGNHGQEKNNPARQQTCPSEKVRSQKSQKPFRAGWGSSQCLASTAQAGHEENDWNPG